MSTEPDPLPEQPAVPAGRRAPTDETGRLAHELRLPAAAGMSQESRRPGPDPQPITGARYPGPTRSLGHQILDTLVQTDAAAQRFRRDLRIINRMLGNRAWLRRSLGANLIAGERVLELGAGTGDLGDLLGTMAPQFAGLDLAPRPHSWPRQAAWFETDVMVFDRWAEYPVVVANLLFHHFDSLGLARIGASIGAHTRVLIASEPLRARRTAALFMTICPFIGAHPVTRHDGQASIAAGIRGDELARLLHLDPDAWHWQTSETWRGSSRLVAVRR